MKKIIFTIVITLGLTMGAMAQTDAFFNDWSEFDNRENNVDLPALPSEHGSTGNQTTPLGTGLLILTALGAGYAVAKRRSENS